MVDDSVDSFVNLELRKRDLESYVFGEEGNLWTNLISKVDRPQRWIPLKLNSESLEDA